MRNRPIRTAIANEGGATENGLRSVLAGEQEIALVGEFTLAHSDHSRLPAGLDMIFLRVAGASLDLPFSLLREATQDFPLCVVVADDGRFALRAIELHVLDYLVVPLEKERVRETLRWARTRLQLQSVPGHACMPEPAGAPLKGNGQKDRLMVKWRGRIFLLRISDIRWIEAEGGYVRLYCSEKKYMLRGRIGDFEQSLPPETFIRIHRSALVNIDRIVEILQLPHGDYAVLLEDGTRLSLSRSFREKVFHQFVDVSRAAV